MPPLLSHITLARNDNYMGNFKSRLEMSLNYTSWQVAKAGRLNDYEILVCDWNSTSPLRENLNLNEYARQCVSFLEVPPETVRKHGLGRHAFHTGLASNVGWRRARGEMTLYTPADVFLPYQSIVNIFDLIEKADTLPFDLYDCFLGVPRYAIPWQAGEKINNIKFLDRYITLHTNLTLQGRLPLGISASDGGHLISKALIHKIRGYTEKYDFGGWLDCDLSLRIAQTAPKIETNAYNIFSYDFFPSPQMLKGQSRNEGSVEYIQVPNGVNWGLGQEEIDYKPAQEHPEINNKQDTSPKAYDLESLLEKEEYDIEARLRACPAVKEPKDLLFKFWRKIFFKIFAGKKSNLAPKLFSLARRGQKRQIFNRMALIALIHDLEQDKSLFSEWFGDTAQLFNYLYTAVDKGAYSLISRWNMQQAHTFLAVLASIARRRPSRFFYAATRDFYVAQAAACVDPTIEIVAYDHYQTDLWTKCHQGGALFCLPLLTEYYLNRLYYKGYCHMLTGPMDNALKRLKKIPLIGDEPFDAIFLDLDYLADINEFLCRDLQPLLADSCVMVCRGGNEPTIKQLLEHGFKPAGNLPGLKIFTKEQ